MQRDLFVSLHLFVARKSSASVMMWFIVVVLYIFREWEETFVVVTFHTFPLNI